MNSAISGRSIPEPGFFARYGVNVEDVDDIQWMPITDSLQYPAAGTQQLTFFANGRGQGATSALNAAAGPKSYADTNLDGNGVLPTPERALIMAIGVTVFPGILPAIGADALADTGLFINDLYQIGRSGFLEWKIGQKTISLDTPLQAYGAGEGLDVMAALSDSTTAGANQLSQISYGRFAGDGYSIVPVALISNQNFPLTLNWPALVPTPSTQPARIKVSLYGYRIRKAQ